MTQRNPIHWLVDGRKNTISVHATGVQPESYKITIDVLGQRANSVTVPARFFQDVLDQIERDEPDEPEAA